MAKLKGLTDVFAAAGLPTEVIDETEPMRSWRPEVIADDSGEWCPNGMRFATKAEAEAYAKDLACRWVLVREWRAVESPDAVNYVIEDGKVRSV